LRPQGQSGKSFHRGTRQRKTKNPYWQAVLSAPSWNIQFYGESKSKLALAARLEINRKTMRDDLALFFALILVVPGAALLYDGIASRDTSQSIHVIGGALLLALGLTISSMALRNWLKWRKIVARQRNG
jgi:hypothetical protein